jgi:hypothetical protein
VTRLTLADDTSIAPTGEWGAPPSNFRQRLQQADHDLKLRQLLNVVVVEAAREIEHADRMRFSGKSTISILSVPWKLCSISSHDELNLSVGFLHSTSEED